MQFFAAVLAVIVVIVTIFLIVRQLQRQHRARAGLLTEKSQHLDTAVDNMTQGLLLFDKPAAGWCCATSATSTCSRCRPTS